MKVERETRGREGEGGKGKKASQGQDRLRGVPIGSLSPAPLPTLGTVPFQGSLDSYKQLLGPVLLGPVLLGKVPIRLLRAGVRQGPLAPEGGIAGVSAENTVFPSTARILHLLPQTA